MISKPLLTFWIGILVVIIICQKIGLSRTQAREKRLVLITIQQSEIISNYRQMITNFYAKNK